MTRLHPLEGLLLNLDQKIKEGRREYLTKSEAREKLKALTGQDFGYDSKKWRAWIEEHKNWLHAQGKPWM